MNITPGDDLPDEDTFEPPTEYHGSEPIPESGNQDPTAESESDDD